MKWYHDFLGFWRVGWNIFDFVIIGASFIVPGNVIYIVGASSIALNVSLAGQLPHTNRQSWPVRLAQCVLRDT